MYWNHLWEFLRWYWRICMYLEMSNEEASIRLDVTLVIAWTNSWLSKNLSSILLERILLCVVCITSPRCCSIRDAVSKPLSVSFKWKKKAPYLVKHSRFRYICARSIKSCNDFTGFMYFSFKIYRSITAAHLHHLHNPLTHYNSWL